MRSLSLVALLLVGACNLILSPDVPHSLTGTWTVQMSFQAIRLSKASLFSPVTTDTLTCTGQTTWTLVEAGWRNGTESGTLPCLGRTSAMNMSSEVSWRLEGDSISISKEYSERYPNIGNTGIRYSGTMGGATTASGKVLGSDSGGGFLSPHGESWKWTSEGTWSATRN